MKGKITDTNNTINKGGRAEKYWRHKPVKSKASLPVRSKDEIDLHKILERYNLKGFEFGNWLNNDERYDRVLACEDSLAELAKIMGTKNLGMDGLVGIAFGARGSKGALAHYEPDYNMNLVVDLAAKTLKDRLKGYPDYWRRRNEIFARLFEQYCAYKLKQEGYRDKFLTSSWQDYVESPVYWSSAEFTKLLPAMDTLIKNMKVVMK